MSREEIDAAIRAFLSWMKEENPGVAGIDYDRHVDDFLDEVEEKGMTESG